MDLAVVSSQFVLRKCGWFIQIPQGLKWKNSVLFKSSLDSTHETNHFQKICREKLKDVEI